MLKYSESVYKHVESSRETMLSDLAVFVLSHSVEDDAEMYKRTTYHGNVKRERYVFNENLMASCSEFIVETESYYERTVVTWWDTSELVKKHYTEKKGV